MTSKPCSQKEDPWKIFTELLHTNMSDEGENLSTAVCPLFL